jgi:type I restriction-modification system DNA methylase subunit
MQKAFETIKQLVADFKAQESAYLSPSYQESQIRQDFIDKFFTALGWDVTHTIQKNPYQQEVHIENKVHMAGSQRRADYAFFLTPNFRDPKFFVEAKKPSRNLANPDDYYQTIRYGWNANTPIAILTDFEEFHILDCRYKPNIKDVMSQKIEYFHYSDYAKEEKFSRIYWLFSHEAVASGSIEKRVIELPKPRGKAIQRGLFKGGYQPVDEAFLEELDEYREVLAKAFKKSNPDLQSEELTEAVQRTIDRLVFIRFLEDKQIEEPEIINLRSKKSVWKGFLALCSQLDPKYNGLVFKPHKIIDGKEFNPPDDEEFVRICDELADPSSPYNFDQIPISILGSIYERFLGKVVHATDKRATVEEKPEVRKAGGVYYTPEYIVRYIVNETVGKLIEGKTPEAIAQMTFADIACGSGSFLIEVYNQLLDYHIRFYIANPAKQKEADVFERDGKMHLTVKKKKEILLNNIFGVDIDFQATEVTQLSLYLKLLEDVTMHDAHQFGMFKETILPDLRQNIINGNSLIGRDIVEDSLFPDVDVEKLKPMNFEDVFPKMVKHRGFDVIVGNPPYIRIQMLNESSPEAVEYFGKKYNSVESGNYDIYVVFVERAFQKLNQSGKLGYILPNKFFRTDYGKGIRNLIAKEKAVEKVVDFGANQVFEVTTYTCLLFLSRSIVEEYQYAMSDADKNALTSLVYDTRPSSLLTGEVWSFVNEDVEIIRKKIRSVSIRLLDLPADMSRGSSSGNDDVFMINGNTVKIEKEILRTPVFATDFSRYSYKPANEWSIIFPYKNVDGHYELMSESAIQKSFPKAYEYLHSYQAILKKRKQYSKWYGYSAPRNLALHEKAEILIPLLANKGSFAPVAAKHHGKLCPMASGGFTIAMSEKCPYHSMYTLGLLNSTLLFWELQQLSNVFRGGWITCTKQYVGELPIRAINFTDTKEKSMHDTIVKLVEQMLDAKDKLSNARTEAETNRFEHLCQTLDRQINEAVYELYGLTEEEIKIVEGK